MRRRTLRFVVLAVACVAAVVAAAGCGSSSSGGDSGTFRIGAAGAAVFDSPNPFVAISSNAFAAYRYMYPFLVQYNKDLDLEGSFASKWTTSADGKTWTFTTHPGAKWSDGQPLTAKDAAWTLSTILKDKAGASASFAPYVTGIASATAPDDNTLVVTVDKPTSTLLASLQYIPILPQHVWAAHDTGKDGVGLKSFSNLPPATVSGGPFVLVKYQKGSIALFKRNANWWGPAPHISAWGMQQYSSPDALVQALKANEIDLALALPPTAIRTVASTSGLTVQRAPGMQYYDIGFNSSPSKTDKPEVRDPQFRLAVGYALNRQDIIDTFLLGAGRPGVSIVPVSDGRWYNKNLQPLPYDPSRANQILDQMGFRRGSDGIRVANGHKMSYQLIYLDTGNNRLVDIMQTNLKAVGIDLQPKLVGDAAYVPAVKAGNYSKFDLSMDFWNATPDPSLILSTQTCASLNPFSENVYCSRAYDALFDQQTTTLDVNARQQVVWQMQDLLFRDRSYDVLFYPETVEGLRNGWTGLVFNGGGSFSSFSDESLLNVRRG